MATAAAPTKQDTPDLSELLGVSLEDVSSDTVIKSSRGRQVGKDVLAIRTVLQEAVKSKSAKAFNGITSTEKKDELVRKIRSAAKGAGTNGTDIDVSTSYDSNSGRLYFGPADVIEKMSAKNQASK